MHSEQSVQTQNSMSQIRIDINCCIRRASEAAILHGPHSVANDEHHDEITRACDESIAASGLIVKDRKPFKSPSEVLGIKSVSIKSNDSINKPKTPELAKRRISTPKLPAETGSRSSPVHSIMFIDFLDGVA